jgi:O-acetyl-ADP-ribose deacetylase (regulator of RNase III)
MTEPEVTTGTRFGRAVIEAVTGELVDQAVQAIVYPASSRGVMGAGPASSVRTAAGEAVEREAMAQAPIELGDAVATSAGRLQERGIGTIVHAAIVTHLGEPAARTTVRRAIDAALRLAEERRLRRIAIPLLGVSTEAADADRAAAAELLVEAVVTHLRRPGSRLEHVVFVSRFEDDQEHFREAIATARKRTWTGDL